MSTITESEIAERRGALEEQTGPWRPRSLAAAFDEAADRYADRPYVITDQGELSYAEVRERSVRLAAGLIALGVEEGDSVALLIDNRLEYPAVKFAIARIGAKAVPLNYSYRPGEIGERLRQSRARVVISVDRSAATDFLAAFDELVPGWEGGVDSTEFPELRNVVLVEASREGAIDLAAVEGMAGDLDEVARRTRRVDPGSVCDIVFTSGTTGHALGATLTHDMVLRSAYGSAYHRAFADGWRVGFALPLYHVFGYIEGMLAVLFVGGAIVPQRVFNPRTTLELIDEHGINEVLFVPTMTVAVVEQAVKGEYRLDSLESVFSAAAPAPVWLWERVLSDLRPRMVFTGYGQTEVSAATALTYPGDDIETVASVVGATKLGGRAAEGVGFDGRLAEYRTVDPFTGEPLETGETGELAVRGPQVTREYFEAADRTRDTIDADGWLRTGDLGRVDDRGYLELSGRSKELFKVGGELVSPSEVERAITAMPGVSQSYVAGVADERMGEVGWAWVVPDEGEVIEARAVTSWVRERLAPFKVPRGVTFLAAEELPMTTTGKIQKFLLVQRLEEG